MTTQIQGANSDSVGESATEPLAGVSSPYPQVSDETIGLPESVQDHAAEPEWDTSTAHDLCLVCEWPVSKAGHEWTHDAKNPCHWVDRRAVSA